MGKTYRELKIKIGQLRFENSFLTSKVEKVLLENGRVKRELQVSNARIVELAQELELLKNGLMFLGQVKEALNDEDFFTEKVGEPILEKMVVSDVAFSSRFMPDVKFKIKSEIEAYLVKQVTGDNCISYGYLSGVFGASLFGIKNYNVFKQMPFQEVSIYEAMPELVPNGMVYDKESDSLIKKDIR